jgi:hypothetical protein
MRGSIATMAGFDADGNGSTCEQVRCDALARWRDVWLGGVVAGWRAGSEVWVATSEVRWLRPPPSSLPPPCSSPAVAGMLALGASAWSGMVEVECG